MLFQWKGRLQSEESEKLFFQIEALRQGCRVVGPDERFTLAHNYADGDLDERWRVLKRLAELGGFIEVVYAGHPTPPPEGEIADEVWPWAEGVVEDSFSSEDEWEEL